MLGGADAIDHLRFHGGQLCNAAWTRRVERFKKSLIPRAHAIRRNVGSVAEQSEDRRRGIDGAVQIDIRKTRHGGIVCHLPQVNAAHLCRVNDDDDTVDVLLRR